MATNENFTKKQRGIGRPLHTWESIVRPHASIQDLIEYRSARLSISLIVVIWVFSFLGFLAGGQRTGYIEAASSFGLSLFGLPIAYALAKTKYYRIGAFLFSIIFSFSAYVDIVRQKGLADVAADIFVFVPVSLIVANTFLSIWAVFLLVGLNIGALFSLPLFGVTLPDNVGGLAGGITTIWAVLFALSTFRNRTESLRLDEVRKINRELEDLTSSLEQRVDERTAELEQANRQTSRRAGQLQAITQLSEAIAQLQDLNELLAAVTRIISEQFGFYHVGIFLVDGGREFAILQAANSEGGQRMLERGHRLKLGTGVVGFTALTGTPRIALDVGADAVFFDNPDLPDTRSEAALPLKSRDATIGVLDVQSTESGVFSNEDLQMLTTLANQVSIAFENTRLLTETRTALNQVQEVYNEFTRVEWSRAVSLAEQAGFRYRAGRIEMLETDLGTPEVLSAVENGRVSVTQAEGERANRSAVAVPVKLRGEVIGILHIESNESAHEWQPDEISLVEAVAERAAFAMENARLFQDARRRAAKEQMISEASARIGRGLDIENILRTTADELERVLGGSEILIQFQHKEAKQ